MKYMIWISFSIILIASSVFASTFGYKRGYDEGAIASRENLMNTLQENIFTKLGNGCKDEVTKLAEEWGQRLKDENAN